MRKADWLRTPPGFDWQVWVDRWERMQDRYLIGRKERFNIICRLVRETQAAECRILDLGCGPGSLMEAMLGAIPSAKVTGLDVDPTLLLLAEKRLADYGPRVKLAQWDLRNPDWRHLLSGPVNAVVSATALHWLSSDTLEELYGLVGGVLSPGGVFLNADHVGNKSPSIQALWDKRRWSALRRRMRDGVDDWKGFWADYLEQLGPQARQLRETALGEWEGVEPGLPLTWHFDRLRGAGFESVDCFWRRDGDAVYGGIRG